MTGCSGSPESGSSVPFVSLEQLAAAPIAVSIEQHSIRLSTYLYRDFMPISPPDGKPMIAVAKIASADSSPLPSGLDADRIWLINGDQVWQGTFSSEARPSDPALLEKVLRNGPMWSPGSKVDVVVRIISPGSEQFLLRAPKQLVHRTD